MRVFHEPDGRIAFFTLGDTEQQIDGLESLLHDGKVDLDKDYVRIEGETKAVIQRPMVASVDMNDLTALPAGTELDIANEFEDSVTVLATDEIELADAGIYTVTVRPPFPFLSSTFRVEVSE